MDSSQDSPRCWGWCSTSFLRIVFLSPMWDTLLSEWCLHKGVSSVWGVPTGGVGRWSCCSQASGA